MTMRKIYLGIALLAAGIVIVSAQAGVFSTDGVRYVVSSQTIADSGNGSPASGTVTALKSYVALTCSDADGCTMSVSEAAPVDGMLLSVVNVSANTATFSDSSGVQELRGGGSVALTQYDSLSLVYRSDRWVELARSAVQPLTEYFHACVTDGGGQYTTWDSNGTDDPTFAAVSGTNVTLCTAAFPDPGPKYLWNHYRLPSDWTGAIDATFAWRTSATSGSVVWQLQTACSADSETIDPSWNTASTVTDAAQGTTNRFNTASITGVTTTGCAAGEMLFFRLARDGGHASDSLAAAADLIGVELKLRRAM